MTPFLKSIAEVYLVNHKCDFEHLTFVFPNKRAGLFFRKYLSDLTRETIWSPQVVGIHDFVFKLSNLQAADKTILMFELYDVYIKYSSRKDAFDEFYFWGDILLSDFNDIDKYCIDAKQLFKNVRDLKDIDQNYDYLDEEQISAIKTFWNNFNPVNTEHKENFLDLWEILYSIYEEFRERLSQKGIGYDGMIYRDVVDQIEKGTGLLFKSEFKSVVFCGFNALTICEKKIFQYFKKNNADFYWDIINEFANDLSNKAYSFVRENSIIFPSKYSIEDSQHLEVKEVEIVRLSSSLGMAQEAGNIIGENNDSPFLNTALVLGDENLLIPCLYSLPLSVEKINVTMGYSLKNSSVYQLIHLLVDLQVKGRRSKFGVVTFYHKHVLAILRHLSVSQLSGTLVREMEEQIVNENRIYVDIELFKDDQLLKLIFSLCDDAYSLSLYLESIVTSLQKNNSDYENEFNYHFFINNKRLRELYAEYNQNSQIKTYASLLYKLMDQLSVPFNGEPLNGLQVLGVLETRNLDFENVIITSMNEGVFPKSIHNNSFIPNNLRKGFGLPTPDLNDRMYSYYFHSIIGRAKKLWLLFDTSNERNGEMSRYCHLLNYEYSSEFPNKISLKQRSVNKIPHFTNVVSFAIPKTQEILNYLKEYLPNGNREFSASAINMHIECSMRFYLHYIKKIRKPDEISEDVDAALLGTVFHNTMESIYRPYQNCEITLEVLKLLSSKVKIRKHVEDEFMKEVKITDRNLIRGRDELVLNIIEQYVKLTIKHDMMKVPFVYLEGEKEVSMLLELGDLTVKVHGFIDRIDKVDNEIRIIDYKSGFEKGAVSDLEQLFDSTSNTRSKGMFQTLFYTLLLHQEGVYNSQTLQPHIYIIRNIGTPSFNSRIKIGKNYLDDFENVRIDFQNLLKTHLLDLFDPNIPFMQTEQHKHCVYCDFKKLCER